MGRASGLGSGFAPRGGSSSAEAVLRVCGAGAAALAGAGRGVSPPFSGNNSPELRIFFRGLSEGLRGGFDGGMSFPDRKLTHNRN